MKSLLHRKIWKPGGRAPQGARGLKCVDTGPLTCAIARRAPQGARGLKFLHAVVGFDAVFVAPRKGRVG